MRVYKYRPVRFYVATFLGTWIFWFLASVTSRIDNGGSFSFALMALGLFMPPAVAVFMVLTSKSDALKQDFRKKLVEVFRIKPSVLVAAILLFALVIVISILLSTLFGQSLEQFALAEFSFSIGGMSTLLLFVVVAFLEELGWRGYITDALASTMTWWKATLIFGLFWSLWHLPLFFIPGTYQYGILQISPIYMVNFFVSILPLSFFFTWVYVKTSRSSLACMIFHFSVNFFQERVGMTDTTKCVQTFVLIVAAGIIVWRNKDLYFGTRHIGNLLGESRNPQ